MVKIKVRSEEEIARGKIQRLLEDAEWDMKARDRDEAREKLEKAKKIAKQIRDEKLLTEILKRIDSIPVLP